LLIVGYSLFYLCRSNLSVVTPQLAKDLASQNATSTDDARNSIGRIMSLGVLAYAFGKLMAGAASHWIKPRPLFLLGMAGAVLFTYLFPISLSLPILTMAWIGNRLSQSCGWPGIVGLASHWYPRAYHARVMGILSLSFLFGDGLARNLLGVCVDADLSWQQIFYVSGSLLGCWLVLCICFLRDSPAAVSAAEPDEPDDLPAAAHEVAASPSLRSEWGSLFANPAFLLVCLLSLGCTLLREVFNSWTPTYFNESVRLAPAESAHASAVFPYLGGVSVLLTAWLGDRFGSQGRAWVLIIGLLSAAATLFALAGHPTSPLTAVTLVGAVGFLLIGPYSYLAGVLSLDLGGKRSSALAAGIIDGAGYLAGVLAGEPVARLVQSSGWDRAFFLLGIVALGTGVVACLFRFFHRDAERQGHAATDHPESSPQGGTT
jgi:OPA family glycerol-3-phosphate transporter-like MFS transporter